MERSVPRPPRYPLIGVPQHVMQRGNNLQPTFFAADDFRFYLECLKEAATNLTPISLFRKLGPDLRATH